MSSPVTGPPCKVCDVRLRNKNDHTAHVSSLPHHVKLAESWKSVGTHYCKLCEVTCRGLKAIEKHFSTEQHLAAIAKCHETIENKEKRREEKKKEKEKKNEPANIFAKFAEEIQSRAKTNCPTASDMDRRRYNQQPGRGDYSPHASHSHHSYDRHSASFDERGMDYRRRPPPLLGPHPPPPPHPHYMDRRDYGYERPVSFYGDAAPPHLPGFRHAQYGQWAEQQPQQHCQQGNWSGEVPVLPPPPGVSVPQHPAPAAREQSTSALPSASATSSQFRRNVDERKSYHGRTERERQASPGGGQKGKEDEGEREKRDRPKPPSRPASACSNHSDGSSSGRKKTAAAGGGGQPPKKKSSAAAAAASLLRKATTVKKLKAVVRVGPAAAVAAATTAAPTPGTSAAPAVVLEDKERKWDKIARRAPDTLRNKSHKRFQERQKKWGLQTADGSFIVDDLGAESSSSSGTEKAKASDDNVSLSSHIWGTGPETQCPDRMKMPSSMHTPSRSELPSMIGSRLRVDDTYMSMAEVRGLSGGGGGGGGGERSGKAELMGLMGGVGVPPPQSASTPVRVKREATEMSPLSTPEVLAKRPTTLMMGAGGVSAHDASFSSTASADVTVIPNPAAAPALLNVKQEVVEGIEGETESAPSPPSLTPVGACPLTGPMPTTREEKMNAMWTLNEMEMKEEAEYARLQDEAKRIMLALTTSQARLAAMKARKQALLQ